MTSEFSAFLSAMFAADTAMDPATAAAMAAKMAVFSAVAKPIAAHDVLTLAQAAAYLQFSEDAVRAEAEAGRIVGRSLDGDWRFLRGEIVAWLRTRKIEEPVRDRAVEETDEEHEAFLASISSYRDAMDRATESGRYAPP